jgi:hypothetical protein
MPCIALPAYAMTFNGAARHAMPSNLRRGSPHLEIVEEKSEADAGARTKEDKRSAE